VEATIATLIAFGNAMNSVQKHYDQFLASHYTWMSGGHASQVATNRETLSRFGVIAPLGATALDLGCGSGYQSLALAELGFTVTAVDTSRQLLDELRSLANEKPVTVVCGDMLDAAVYRNHGPFDVVVCMGDTLTHVHSMEAVARLFRDVNQQMQPGGALLLAFRDLSHELEGIDRLIPVKLDADSLMAAFLEYKERHVTVHDMLFSRENGGWRMTKGAYMKLRLSAEETVAMLAGAGFSDVTTTFDRGFTTVVAKKPKS